MLVNCKLNSYVQIQLILQLIHSRSALKIIYILVLPETSSFTITIRIAYAHYAIRISSYNTLLYKTTMKVKI